MRSMRTRAIIDRMKKVVIIGAGVAGLTLGNLLLRRGVDCVILEKQSRDYVMQRQRAGVIDTRAVRMFREWGLEERVVGGVPTKPVLNFRIDGKTRCLALDSKDHDDSRFCSQQLLVRNLIDVYLADGGDLRFETDATLADIDADLIAGCDGDHGVSRAGIPEDRIARHTHDYGYAWLTVLAEVPPNHQGMMAIHSRGFAGQFARGPKASRFYLQCPLDSAIETWTDERIWDELEARFEEPISERGRIASKQLVPIRSVVTTPMQHGRLFLLGDAAHIVPPMSAKGMNLAFHDASLLANAVVEFKRGNTRLLEDYSPTALRHVWRYQAFAAWWTTLIHDAGAQPDVFRRSIARAELEHLFESPSANRRLSEFLAGLA